MRIHLWCCKKKRYSPTLMRLKIETPSTYDLDCLEGNKTNGRIEVFGKIHKKKNRGGGGGGGREGGSGGGSGWWGGSGWM